jgi:hypothetical protein
MKWSISSSDTRSNAELVRAVYDELQQANPDGFRYATFQLDDGLTFHPRRRPGGRRSDPLPELEAFRRFRADVHERCDEGPIASSTWARLHSSFPLADARDESATGPSAKATAAQPALGGSPTRRGDVEHRQIGLPHLALGPDFDPPVDARKRAFAGCVVVRHNGLVIVLTSTKNRSPSGGSTCCAETMASFPWSRISSAVLA